MGGSHVRPKPTEVSDQVVGRMLNGVIADRFESIEDEQRYGRVVA